MKKIKYFQLFSLLITTINCIRIEENDNNKSLGYDPEEILTRIFNFNNSTEPRQAGYGLTTFENAQNFETPNAERPYGFVNFGQQSHQNDDNQNFENNLVVFQDQNDLAEINQDPLMKPQKKKRRRRRKPRLQKLPHSGYGLQYPPLSNAQNVGFGQNPYGGYPNAPNGQYFRPPHRRPKPMSLAEEALSTITRALESIAVYDDFQCVPRLLCEAAGGGATNKKGESQSSLLSTFIDIQPLITLLGAYSGVSSSPLFVFGRAVFLGMTSKENNGVCRYAYPLCPTDPEKLVDYLNNHNGGFFRFFNTPPQPSTQPGFNGQSTVQQFYSQLSNIPGQLPFFPNQHQNTQRPGVYSGPYDFQQTNIGSDSGLYGNKFHNSYGFQQNYGHKYPYDHNNGYGLSDINRYKNGGNEQEDTKIQKRIQNNPRIVFVNNNHENELDNVKWTFPESNSFTHKVSNDGFRGGKTLTFPQEAASDIYPTQMNPDKNSFKTNSFKFPGEPSNRQYLEYNTNPPVTGFKDFVHNTNPTVTSFKDFVHNTNPTVTGFKDFVHNTNPTVTGFKDIVHNTNPTVTGFKDFVPNGGLKYDENGYYIETNDYVESNDFVENNNSDNEKVVYVLRGNADPNNPEIVRLKPGQKIV